ncbi:hypothetical protein RhiirC2_717811 [Rhizophagus irregularis]|uniref:Uncharacterized protein n=1 Tax=Rhizophagus irregularis TaxID=588596 RepID=A0A2N1MKX0_9GLOM|nr:hypothetical protein RhiirC2_717811 [Rhizophagus irregularis]
MQHITSREATMNKSIEEKDKKNPYVCRKNQVLDSTIEPKTYSNAYERDSWYDLRRGVENDPEIRKKYTFRKNSVTQELYIPSRNSPRSNRERDKTIEKIHIFAKSKGYRDSSGATK